MDITQLKNKKIGYSRMNKISLILIIFLCMLFVIFNCEKKRDNPLDPKAKNYKPPNQEKPDATPPVLSVTPVDISGPYDPGNGTYGDINFNSTALICFGDKLGPDRFSPAIEYYTITNAIVRASTAGIVTWIFKNDGLSDYEIHIALSKNSLWLIIYDHILEPVISVNDQVKAGDILGKAGEWSASVRRTELQINYTGDKELSYCPLNFGTSDFIQKHENLLQELHNHSKVTHCSSVCVQDTVIP